MESARAAGMDGFVVKGASYNILLSVILGKEGPPNRIDSEKGKNHE
jgi:hypothetical protein